jgi:hypothetical protein
MRRFSLRSIPAILCTVVALGGCDGESDYADASPDPRPPEGFPQPTDTPSFADRVLLPPEARLPQDPPLDDANAMREEECDPNYDPCVPIASDVDCAAGSGNGPRYVEGPVRVIERDIYRLDTDRDGVGCESYSP